MTQAGKRYRAPTLVRYGRIESITSGQTGPDGDGKSGMAMGKNVVRRTPRPAWPQRMTTKSKKPYRKPALVRYGRVEAITAGSTGTFTDGKSGMSMTPMGMGMGMALADPP